MSKKAQPVREDHLEKQETAYELRLRIQKAFRLSTLPNARTVQRLLERTEALKTRGLTQ